MTHTTTRLGRLGAWCFDRRGRVLALWIAALALAVGLLMPLGGEFGADYRTPGADSTAAQEVLERSFPDRSGATIDVVLRGPFEEVAGRFAASAQRLDGIAGAGPVEVSPDGTTAIVRLQLEGGADAEVPGASIDRLTAMAERASGDGLRVELGGMAVGEAQEGGASPEMVGFLVAAVVLLFTFGSVLAAGLPLLSALMGLGIATSLVGILALVLGVPEWATALSAMLGIGVGIDYALLVVTRFRAALAAGAQPRAAVAEAVATAGRSVLVAGLTVVIAVLGLFAMGLPYLYGVALSAALAVLVAAVAAVTLLPAALAVLGRRVDALRIPGSRATAAGGGSARWRAWSRAVQRRPWTATLASAAVLVALAVPVTELRLAFPDAGNDPAGTTTRQAYDLVADAFGPGASGPLLLTAEGAGPAELAQLRERVAATPGVASVSEPRPAPGGGAAVLMAIPASSPQAEETQRLIERLRDDALPGVARPTGMELHVGGVTASILDQSAYTADRLPLFIGAVVGLSFLLLLVAFRSVPVALKAGAMNLLSIGAAYGVVALLAQGGWAGELIGIDTATPVPPFIPVLMFAVLFGLSMDYEVFLLSRIREEFLTHGSTSRAVADGLASTGRVITAAAAIMVAVFSAFALSDEIFLKLMGIGMASAILVDATLVRMALVPAVMQLLGRYNWWMPRRLERWLPASAPAVGRPATGAARP